jgi:hypothetical protein
VNSRCHCLARALLCWLAVTAAGCGRSRETEPGDGEAVLPARKVADMVHAVLAADRAVYTSHVINRLTVEQKVQIIDPDTQKPQPLVGSEEWKSEHGRLPLPAQMFRMGAEQVLTQETGLSYVLLSPWPINKKNRPVTAIERQGLAQLTGGGDRPAAFYRTEQLARSRYFTAIYPDVAVAQACVDCHNQHPDSPRKDFKVGDVLGGVVVRLRLD